MVKLAEAQVSAAPPEPPGPTEELAAYLFYAQALHSDVPEVRRPAIAALMQMARQSSGLCRVNAERALVAEFGPYAVSHGLSGCSGPIEAVYACNEEGRDCRNCPWLWLE